MSRRQVPGHLLRTAASWFDRNLTVAPLPADLDDDFLPLLERCRPYTMTSVERMFALYKACQYVARAGVGGDVVECGVWRGGSSMLAAAALAQCEPAHSRRFFLYDTFAGMSEPSAIDGSGVMARWREQQRAGHNEWCYAPLDDVRSNMLAVGVSADRLELVEGKVEDTVPAIAPEEIALLRLDTDWYESTAHELRHLYPRLVRGGVLIIDDYGRWEGARRAVDEFLEHHPELLLVRVDSTGRVAVKP